MRPKRLRTYIFYLLAITILLPLLMLSYSQYRMIEQEIKKDDLVLSEDALALSNNIKSRVEAAKSIVVMSANVYQIYGPGNQQELRRLLKSVVSTVPYFLNIHFGNAQGQVVAFEPPFNAKGESNENVSHLDRDHWKHIHNRDSVFISDVIQAKGAANIPIVNICAPAINRAGEIIGYAVSALDLKLLYEGVVAGLDLKDSVIYILDSKGAPIYATDHSNSPESIISPQKLKNLADVNGKAQVLARNDASDLVGAIEEIPELGWYVGVFKKDEDRQAALFAMVATNTLIFFFLLLATFLLANLAVRPLSDAVNKLIEQVREGRAVPTEAEKIKAPEELVELQKAFCRLLVKVKNHQTDLVENSGAVDTWTEKEVELIKEQNEFLEATITLLPTPMAIVDENGFVRFFNQEASKFFGEPVTGAYFMKVLRDKFDVEDAKLTSKAFLKGKILRTHDSKSEYSVLRRELPAVGDLKRSVYVFSQVVESSPKKE